MAINFSGLHEKYAIMLKSMSHLAYGNFSKRRAEAELGQRLASARRLKKLNQMDVVRMLRLGGQTNISKVETGDRRLDWLELEELAALYGKPPAYFTTLSESEIADLAGRQPKRN